MRVWIIVLGYLGFLATIWPLPLPQYFLALGLFFLAFLMGGVLGSGEDL